MRAVRCPSPQDSRIGREARQGTGGNPEPGGNFVFQQVHNILADVPPENIIAMLDAVNG